MRTIIIITLSLFCSITFCMEKIPCYLLQTPTEVHQNIISNLDPITIYQDITCTCKALNAAVINLINEALSKDINLDYKKYIQSRYTDYLKRCDSEWTELLDANAWSKFYQLFNTYHPWVKQKLLAATIVPKVMLIHPKASTVTSESEEVTHYHLFMDLLFKNNPTIDKCMVMIKNNCVRNINIVGVFIEDDINCSDCLTIFDTHNINYQKTCTSDNDFPLELAVKRQNIFMLEYLLKKNPQYLERVNNRGNYLALFSKDCYWPEYYLKIKSYSKVHNNQNIYSADKNNTILLLLLQTRLNHANATLTTNTGIEVWQDVEKEIEVWRNVELDEKDPNFASKSKLFEKLKEKFIEYSEIYFE